MESKRGALSLKKVYKYNKQLNYKKPLKYQGINIRRADNKIVISRETINKKMKEYLEAGGTIKKYKYLGDGSLVDIEGIDDRETKDGDKDILRGEGRVDWDLANKSDC